MSPDLQSQNRIIIDEDKGLVFTSEEELYAHFFREIETLEKEFFDWRNADKDLPETDFHKYERQLDKTLEDPDEIWDCTENEHSIPLVTYIRKFDVKETPIYHVAVVYLTQDIPSFVYLHFPTTDPYLVERYRRGDLVYDEIIKNAPEGAIEGDALLEGDELARGLYQAMMTLRSEQDITEENFREYAVLREPAIEEADEIWRANDSMGNVLVSFIKDFSDQFQNHNELFYVVVTVEDTPSNSHALLFSFPTTDPGLLTRYRHGDNLQAEEVVQEASH